MNELIDHIELLSAGDDFAFHVAMRVAWLALHDEGLGLQAIRKEPRFYDWIMQNDARIIGVERTTYRNTTAQWEKERV